MARIKGAKKTNGYPDEFKVKAVLLANQPVGMGSGHANYLKLLKNTRKNTLI